MKYDFETITPAVGAQTPALIPYSTHTPQWPEAVNFGVAEMKFALAPAIRQALIEAAQLGSFGYTYASDYYKNAVCNWMEKRHGWKIDASWLTQTYGVVSAIGYALRAFTKEGDRVIIQPPVYGPFWSTTVKNHRELALNPLIERDGRWKMDLEGFRALAADEHTTAFILCSPHNPIGRVWTKEELAAVAAICEEYNVFIISDEIHMDLIYPGYTHTMTASVSDWVRDNSVTLTSPSKGFNLAGLTLANIIVPNEERRAAFCEQVSLGMGGHHNVMSYNACAAAYAQSEEWLDECIAYLEENKNTFIRELKRKLPRAHVNDIQGTYLIWVDLSAYGWDKNEIKRRFNDDAHFHVQSGEFFCGTAVFGGNAGGSCIRVNLACPRRCIVDAIARLESVE